MAQTTTTSSTRTITISLRKQLLNLHASRRRKRVVGLVREAVARHTKSKVTRIKINHEFNEFLGRSMGNISALNALKLSVEKKTDGIEVSLYGAKKATPTSTAPAATASAAAPKKETGEAAKK